MTTVKNDQEVFTKYDFADIMKDLRFSYRATQKEFAERLGIKKSYLSMIELGERVPDAIVIRQIADKLGCSTDFLLGKDEAESHDDSFVCKRTGLSRDAVKILHEAVSTKSNKYQILVDLFDYLLHEYKTYKKEFALTSDDSETGDSSMQPSTDCQYIRIINDTDTMFESIISALGSMSSAITRKTENYSLPGDQGHREDLLKRFEAQEYLNKHGEVVIMAEKAKDYYLREAADKFRDVISAFCEIKMRKNPDYALKVIDVHGGEVSREAFDALYK